MKSVVLVAAALYSGSALAATTYSLVKEYSGTNFFDGWEFYDNYDNTTDGDIEYVSQTNATADKLAYVSSNGVAVIRVDNTTFVPYNDKRDSVRITTTDFFPSGSVIVMDASHMPYGCSIWPSFWTKGVDWPAGGEIDIVEAINGMTANEMALHTNAGCNASTSATFSGDLSATNCNASSGCQFIEEQQNSFGPGFAAAGGGVFATLFDDTQISIWFWTRSSVPSSVSSATTSVDISDWGTPSANYSTGACDISQYFTPQQLVLDITMCGEWAGDATIYAESCPIEGGATANASSCYLQNVINDGNQTALATAYFEINYIKAFNANSSVLTSAGAATSSVNPSSAAASATASGSGASTATGSSSSAAHTTIVVSGAAKAWTAVASIGALIVWTLM